MNKSKIVKAMDYLDDDLIAGAIEVKELKKEQEPPREQKGERKMTKKNIWRKLTAAAAALVLVITGAIVINSAIIRNAGAVIAFDVNPSLEIEINKDEKVTKVNALNQDAITVIGDMDLEGVDLEVAVNAIVGSMLQNGYLTTEQNSILVSIDSKNNVKVDELKLSVQQKISTILEGSSIEASVITQKFDKSKAENQSEISAGKSALIEKILTAGITKADGIPYTRDELTVMKVHELKLLVESKNLTVEGIDSTGTASTDKFKTRDEILEKVFNKAGVTQNDVRKLEVEFDFDKDTRKVVYEVEFTVGEYEYDYELDAETGDIIEEEKERADEEDREIIPDGCIEKSEALSVALTHAQLEKSEVQDIDIDFVARGEAAVFVVEFEKGNTEYKYVINAKTSEIINSRTEIDD